jgi:serine/threonine-protein kinase
MYERSVTLAGTTLADRYDLLEQLGTGGFGSVYRVYDRELDELVALKVIHTELAADPQMLARFRQEVKIARRVTHINVARTFELGSQGSMVFCTMELVDGESLRGRLDRQHRLPHAEAIAIARELCQGLAAAHAVGVIHRDIKPDNVLIAADGRIVLADFGVAAIAASEGDASGTPAYMAPEQAIGEPATPAADVFSVGMILHEMVTGLRPVAGFALEIDANIPHELARTIAAATAPDPAARIASALELGKRLGDGAHDVEHAIEPAQKRGDDHPLATVIVLAPLAAGDGQLLHIADGVYEQLLRRLARRPRLRVLARAEAKVAGALVVALHADHRLSLALCRDREAPVMLDLPLAMSSIALVAQAAEAAIVAAAEPGDRHAAAAQAAELVLRARQLARGGFRGIQPGLELLERARGLTPRDPAILANHALGLVRATVIAGTDDNGRLERAQEAVREALAVAPTAAESHVAAAQLELQIGDAVTAARHFRTAIACSRYLAEGHEGLGRMLLEAGFADRALARIEDALAIAPYLNLVHWEIVRDLALAGRWDEHDRRVADLVVAYDRPLIRLRHALWRTDLGAIRALRAVEATMKRQIDPRVVTAMFEATLDGAWPAARLRMLEVVAEPRLFARRRALYAQFAAEVAGLAGDVSTCTAMIQRAVDHGLYDRAWLERCPLLAEARRHPAYEPVLARVERRAHAILDALYGDAEPWSEADTVAV